MAALDAKMRDIDLKAVLEIKSLNFAAVANLA